MGEVSVIADYAFIWPFRLLEVALRNKGFFNEDSNLPDVPQLQKDLNDLRKRLDSHPDLPEEWYMPEIEVMMPRADLRRTTFVTAVNEMRAEKGEVGWPKHQKTNLLQNIRRFYGHSKVKRFMKFSLTTLVLQLVFLVAGTRLGFLAAME